MGRKIERKHVVEGAVPRGEQMFGRKIGGTDIERLIPIFQRTCSGHFLKCNENY